ncbi:hypothetical protein G7Y89_g5519 [Cudoniella acicularis]|uniref:Uncharacterized protein n=1 Tax=Cudoniella acicularis TaxID=354080 RepID=A0A8H4W3X0_9HELO|nr:hypothetical protein G7Y89_g5519 [Cudoniella acicularis]
MFLNGSSIDDSTEAFIKLVDLAFKPRNPRPRSRFFPPKKIDRVEVVAMFLLAKEPDFIVSLGTGTPRTNNDKPSISVSSPLSL